MLEECEVCRQSTGNLYTCKECGKRFCHYCGGVAEKLCIDCLKATDDKRPAEEEKMSKRRKAR